MSHNDITPFTIILMEERAPRFSAVMGVMDAHKTGGDARLHVDMRVAAVMDAEAEHPFCIVPVDSCSGSEPLALLRAEILASMLEDANAKVRIEAL